MEHHDQPLNLTEIGAFPYLSEKINKKIELDHLIKFFQKLEIWWNVFDYRLLL